MSLSPQIIDALVESGCTVEQLAAVVKASLSSDLEKAAHVRELTRKRVQNHRARNALHCVTNVTPIPDKKNPPDPLKELTLTPIKNSEAKASSSKGCRIPADFKPNIQAALAVGLSLSQAQLEASNFMDYWIAKDGPDAKKRDWAATERRWYRTAFKSLPVNRYPKKRNYVDAAMDMVARGELDDHDETSPWGNHSNVELLSARRAQPRLDLAVVQDGSGRGPFRGDH